MSTRMVLTALMWVTVIIKTLKSIRIIKIFLPQKIKKMSLIRIPITPKIIAKLCPQTTKTNNSHKRSPPKD